MDREIIAWALGIAIATAATIWGTVYVVNNILAPPDPSDPLSKQGGLKREQRIEHQNKPLGGVQRE